MSEVVQENTVTVIDSESELIITHTPESVTKELLDAYRTAALRGYDSIDHQYYDVDLDVDVIVMKKGNI